MSPRRAKRPLSEFQERLKETTRRAKLLKKAGFNISYTGGRKSSPSQRGAVTRLYRRISTYTKPEHRFAFKKLAPINVKRARSALAPNQVTPRGIFVQIPKGTPVSPKYVRFKPGSSTVRPSIQVHSRTGYIDYIKLDPSSLAVDPVAEIRAAITGKRRPISTQIVVNGYQSSISHGLKTPRDLTNFYQYWDALYQETTDDEVRAEKQFEVAQSTRPGHPLRKRYGGRAMTQEEFSNKFQLKLNY